MIHTIGSYENETPNPHSGRLRRRITWGIVLVLIAAALCVTILRMRSPLPGLQEELGMWLGTVEGPTSSEQVPMESASIRTQAEVDLTVTKSEWNRRSLPDNERFFCTAEQKLATIGQRYGVPCVVLRVHDTAGNSIYEETISTRRPVHRSAFIRDVDKWRLSLLDSKPRTGIGLAWLFDRHLDLYVNDTKWNSLPRQKREEFLQVARRDLSAICRRHDKAADYIKIRVLSGKDRHLIYEDKGTAPDSSSQR